MKELLITINKNMVQPVLVDEDDFESLSKVRWFKDSKGYAYSTKRIGNGKRITTRMHRMIMNAPKGMSVDHINGNKLDNRKSNLRICTHAENLRNLKKAKNNTSGFKGVSWYPKSKKWRAVITFGGKYHHLGLFVNKQDAIDAYNQKAKEYFGQFAYVTL